MTMTKKSIFTIAFCMIVAVFMSCFVLEADAANVNDVKFETFITSVKAGEFDLSDEEEDKFFDAIEDGNTEAAMEIYRDYFDGDSLNDTPAVGQESTDSEDVSAADENQAVENTDETTVATDDVAVSEPAVEEEKVEAVPAVESTPVVQETVVSEDNGGLTDAEFLALCKIVEAEAPHEPADGKLLVANVVMNRVKSLAYPNNVTDVIMQRGQFGPVRNGQFAAALPSPSTIAAVKRALNGENLAPGVTSFKRGSSKVWGSKTLAFTYGNHSFYY